MQLFLQGLSLQEEARKGNLHQSQWQGLTLKAWEAVAHRCPDIQNTRYVMWVESVARREKEVLIREEWRKVSGFLFVCECVGEDGTGTVTCFCNHWYQVEVSCFLCFILCVFVLLLFFRLWELYRQLGFWNPKPSLGSWFLERGIFFFSIKLWFYCAFFDGDTNI